MSELNQQRTLQLRFLADPLAVAYELGAIVYAVATNAPSPVACHGLLPDGDSFIDWAADWAGPEDRVIVHSVRKRIGG